MLRRKDERCHEEIEVIDEVLDTNTIQEFLSMTKRMRFAQPNGLHGEEVGAC